MTEESSDDADEEGGIPISIGDVTGGDDGSGDRNGGGRKGGGGDSDGDGSGGNRDSGDSDGDRGGGTGESNDGDGTGGDDGGSMNDIELPDPFGGDGLSLPSGRTLVGIGGVLALLLLGLLWFFRPWLHPVVYGILYRSPSMIQWLLLTVVFGALGIRWLAVRPWAARALLLLGVLSLVLVFLGPVVGGEYTNEHLAGEVQAEVTELSELPDTDTDTPRILPAAVAQQFAQNSLQFPRHSLGVGDITFVDGVPHWSYPLQPDGLVNTFVGKQAGAVFVDMTTQSKRVSVTERAFSCGQGQQLTDNYRWQLRKSKFTVSYQDPFMIKHADDLYMAVPYVRHDHQFRATPIPQVYTVPRFAGVAIVNDECEITHLSPEEARTNEILTGQRYYPYDLARLRVNSMQYQNGILNKWFTHEEQLEIAPVPGENNDQPFTVTTKQGITYVVAAEPWGDAAGIYQIWTIDGRTGEMARFKTDVQSAMLGPRKAANFVEQNNPRVNWGSMSPSEPLPVVRNGTLYWEVRVVPDSGAGVTYTAFVNAESGDVIRYDDDRSITAFMSGAGPIPGGGGADSPGNGTVGGGDGSAGFVVVVVDEDGNVVRTIPVGENESIRVDRRQGNRTNATESPGAIRGGDLVGPTP